MAGQVISREPAWPDRVVGTFELLDAAAVADRIERAGAAQAGWLADPTARATGLQDWANAVAARSDELVDLLVREVGKPRREARAEVGRTVAILRYYAQAVWDPVAEILPSSSGTEIRVQRRPLGVVAAICPWNFPIAIPAWKLAPALAYGNTVLFKPSSSALATGHALAEAAAGAFPEGVLQIVPASADAAAALIDDSRVAGVSFTGSVPVGHDIVRRVAGRGGLVQAEMGGQNAAIVLDDADLGAAATTIARAAMEFAGQKCTATRRVIVSSAVASRFVPLVVDAVRGLRVGDPDDAAVDLGPLISQRARDEVEQSVAGAVARGGRLLAGGERPLDEGWFVDPAVVEVDDPGDQFTQDETFGPALAILISSSDDEAVAIANATRFGLAGSVFGTDIDRAAALAARLDAGLQRVNAPTTGVDFYAPFGGEKASGYGPREQGRAARDFYTKTRTMFIRSQA